MKWLKFLSVPKIIMLLLLPIKRKKQTPQLKRYYNYYSKMREIKMDFNRISISKNVFICMKRWNGSIFKNIYFMRKGFQADFSKVDRQTVGRGTGEIKLYINLIYVYTVQYYCVCEFVFFSSFSLLSVLLQLPTYCTNVFIINELSITSLIKWIDVMYMLM